MRPTAYALEREKPQKTKPRKQTKAKFQTELEVHVMQSYLQRC